MGTIAEALNTPHSVVEVTYREVLAMRRIGTMGTVSPPTKGELEDMRVLREMAMRIEKSKTK